MGAADRAQEEKRIAGIAHGDVTVSGKGEFEAIATPRKVIGGGEVGFVFVGMLSRCWSF